MKTIFIVLDTIRRDYLTAYGNDWVQTPAVTKLAQSGVTFDNHFVGSLPCMPARREFMTGRYNFIYRGWGPVETFDKTFVNELRWGKTKTFLHLLTDHYHYFQGGGEGYHTGFNTWEFFRGQESDPWTSMVDAISLPDWRELSPTRTKVADRQIMQNFKNRLRQVNEEDFSGPRTAQRAVEWLEVNHAADNWFLQVEIFDPHEPFICAEKYRKMYNDIWEGPEWDWPDYDIVRQNPDAIDHIRKCYAGLLTQTDYWAGKILSKLEELKIFDEVLVVFTTDHGTMLAEHDVWMKNYMPVYNEIIRIPLIVKLPGNARAGERISALTQTVDLMPTFLDYFGAEPLPYLHGKSLRPLLESTAARIREDGLFGYFGKATNITDGRHVYMRMPVNADGGPLYSYSAIANGGYSHWHDRDANEKIQMGRYFGHAYNLPMYKIPAKGEVPRGGPNAPEYLANHLLFDIIADPAQNAPIHDAQIESHFINRINHWLGECEAQPEQYARLGLLPP